MIFIWVGRWRVGRGEPAGQLRCGVFRSELMTSVVGASRLRDEHNVKCGSLLVYLVQYYPLSVFLQPPPTPHSFGVRFPFLWVGKGYEYARGWLGSNLERRRGTLGTGATGTRFPGFHEGKEAS